MLHMCIVISTLKLHCTGLTYGEMFIEIGMSEHNRIEFLIGTFRIQDGEHPFEIYMLQKPQLQWHLH